MLVDDRRTVQARVMPGSRTINWDLSAWRTIVTGAATNEDKGLELRRL